MNPGRYAILLAFTVACSVGVISAGDSVGRGDRYEHWSEHLYEPGRVLWRGIPWFPVRGNHGGEYPLAHDMLPLPNNNQWYARTYGPLRIVVLDATSTRLELEAIDPVNGEVLDAFTILSKPAL